MRYIKGDYFIVPNRQALRGLNCRDQATFVALCSMADEEGVCWPSFQHIADTAGMSRTSAVESIKVLEDAGFIERTKRGRKDGSQTSNEYQICLNFRPPSTPGDLGVVRQATTNDNHYEQQSLTSETKVSQESDFSIETVDDNGDPYTPRWGKKDTSYREVFELWGKYPKSWERNTTQIKAAKALKKEREWEQVKKAVQFYLDNSEKPFTPNVSTPYDLDTKWEKLLEYKYRDRR